MDAETPLDSPVAVENFWRASVASQPDHKNGQEHLVSIMLDAELRPLGYHVIAVGCLDECLGNPRDVLLSAIVFGAKAVVLAHNHPSGDPTPSELDHRLNCQVRDAAAFLKIHIVDHVITGDAAGGSRRYYSFREAGIL